MGNINEYQVQNVIDELRSKANQFSEAAQMAQSRAEYLSGISLDITYSASDWMGAGSSSFQNAWGQFHYYSRKAVEALNGTANAFNNLASRLENALQTKREAEQRANALLLATIGLTLLDIIQLGLDPATDVLTVGTAAGAAAAAAQAVDLGMLVAEADVTAEIELMGIVTTMVGTINRLDEGSITALPEGELVYGGTESKTLWFESPTSTVEGSIENKKPSLFAGLNTSIWSTEKEKDAGQFYGAPITDTGKIEVGKTKLGVGIQQDKSGATEVGIIGAFTLFNGSIDSRIGSKDLGWTGGLETEVGGAEGFAGWNGKSLGADAGITLISDTVSTGVNIDNVNVGVDATIGLKYELGIEIGPQTEIKLPFISFGFSIGAAK
ncbi:MAG: hypothetical protein NVSMB27_05450 [Ktedonobacteraceae bacterium]